MTSDRQRKRAFAAAVACLIATVAVLVLLDGGQKRERPVAPSTARSPGAVVSGDVQVPAAATEPPPRPILPAGQALPPEDALDRRPGRSPGPPAVRAAARRFVLAYLDYELGRATPAQHEGMLTLTGGRLRSTFRRQPPRPPIGVALERGRLHTIDAVTEVAGAEPGAFWQVAYTVRRRDAFMLHAIVVGREEDGRWVVIDLLG